MILVQRAGSDVALNEQGTARPGQPVLNASARGVGQDRSREEQGDSGGNGGDYGGGSAFAALATDITDEDEPKTSKPSFTLQSSKSRSPSMPLPEEMPSMFADGGSLQDLLSMLQSKGGERIPSFRAPSFSALQHMQQQLRALNDAGRLSDATSGGSEIPKGVAEQVEELINTELSLRAFDSTNLPDLPALLQSLGSASAPYVSGTQPGQKGGDGDAGAAGGIGDQQGASSASPGDTGEGQALGTGLPGPQAGLQVGTHGRGAADMQVQQQEQLQGEQCGLAGLMAVPIHANAGPVHATPLPSPHGSPLRQPAFGGFHSAPLQPDPTVRIFPTVAHPHPGSSSGGPGLSPHRAAFPEDPNFTGFSSADPAMHEQPTPCARAGGGGGLMQTIAAAAAARMDPVRASMLTQALGQDQDRGPVPRDAAGPSGPGVMSGLLANALGSDSQGAGAFDRVSNPGMGDASLGRIGPMGVGVTTGMAGGGYAGGLGDVGQGARRLSGTAIGASLAFPGGHMPGRCAPDGAVCAPGPFGMTDPAVTSSSQGRTSQSGGPAASGRGGGGGGGGGNAKRNRSRSTTPPPSARTPDVYADDSGSGDDGDGGAPRRQWRPEELPPPFEVYVTGLGRQVDEQGKRISITVEGLFHCDRYLANQDCIWWNNQFVSRSRFEKEGGSTTAKWHCSIKVASEKIAIGTWLQDRNLPVLKGCARKSKRQRVSEAKRAAATASQNPSTAPSGATDYGRTSYNGGPAVSSVHTASGLSSLSGGISAGPLGMHAGATSVVGAASGVSPRSAFAVAAGVEGVSGWMPGRGGAQRRSDCGGVASGPWVVRGEHRRSDCGGAAGAWGGAGGNSHGAGMGSGMAAGYSGLHGGGMGALCAGHGQGQGQMVGLAFGRQAGQTGFNMPATLSEGRMSNSGNGLGMGMGMGMGVGVAGGGGMVGHVSYGVDGAPPAPVHVGMGGGSQSWGPGGDGGAAGSGLSLREELEAAAARAAAAGLVPSLLRR